MPLPPPPTRVTTRTYKPTFFDRHGPDGAHVLIASGYAVIVFFCSLMLGGVLTWKYQIRGFAGIAFIVVFASALTAAVGWAGLRFSAGVGNTWLRFAVDGTSTPYIEQYSYQQALVMQGRLDDALESFEAVIAEKPGAVDPRVRAAELYSRDKGNHGRAAELFREVQRIESVSSGEFIYATNRLVDLYSGPLSDPGRALVELRRLIERYPGVSGGGACAGGADRGEDQTAWSPRKISASLKLPATRWPHRVRQVTSATPLED